MDSTNKSKTTIQYQIVDPNDTPIFYIFLSSRTPKYGGEMMNIPIIQTNKRSFLKNGEICRTTLDPVNEPNMMGEKNKHRAELERDEIRKENSNKELR